MSEVAEIKPINLTCDFRREPQGDLIEMLERNLERARRGEIQACAAVIIDRDDNAFLAVSRPEHVSFVHLIAHLGRLERWLYKLWDELQ